MSRKFQAINKKEKYRPRICINKSSKHIYVQLIDDIKEHTLLAVSTVDGSKASANISKCKDIGAEFGKKIKEIGLEKVCFDRNGFKYHGRIKAIADGIRESGLDF